MRFLMVLCFVAALGAQPAAFDVASVKPARPDDRAWPKMGGSPETGQISFTNVTLQSALMRAYDVKNYQVDGPSWIGSVRYDMIAKAPPETNKEQFNVMLQNLLAERFRLALHHETREFKGYELVQGKNGSKLKVSALSGPDAPEPTEAPKTDANGFPQLDGPELLMMEGMKGQAVVTYLTAEAQPLSKLVELLSKEFRIPIADQTGLAGKYDFMLEFAPRAPGSVEPETDDSAANLLSAVQHQLGLKLNPRKIPLDVLVIDRADRIPTEN